MSSFDRSKPYTFSADLKRDSGNTGVQMGIALKNSIEGEWIYQNQINANAGINDWSRVSITSSGLDQYEADYMMVYIKVNAPSGGTLYARRAKLEQGSVATPYVPRPYIEELMLLANDRVYLDFEFLNGWKNSSSGANDLIIWKDPWGYVHMAGSICGGSAEKVLELPEGYRTERTYAAFVRNASEGTITDAHLFITGADMSIFTDSPLSNTFTVSAYYYGV